MKQIILLGSKDAGNKNDIGLLAQSLQEQHVDADIKVCYWEDMVFVITAQDQAVTDGATQADFAAADLVVAMNWYKTGALGFYRDMAFALALYLQHKGITFWNSEMLQQRSSTKLSALMQLALQGVDVPKTVFTLNSGALMAANDMDFPLIVKTIAGSRGVGNYLARDNAQLQEIFAKDGGKTPFMIEEFIPNDHDLRVVCYGGQPALIIKRSRTSDATHLNNTSQGATAELLPLDQADESVLHMGREACRILGREIAGVDIVLANNGSKRMVCLEVNAIPQLTSGSYVPEKAQKLAAALNEYLKGTA